RRQQRELLFDDRSRHHHPDHARPVKLRDQILARRGTGDARLQRRADGGRMHVVHHACMAPGDEPAHHRRPHSSQSDHSELHHASPTRAPREASTATTILWSCRSSTSVTGWLPTSIPSTVTCCPLPPSFDCVTSMW